MISSCFKPSIYQQGIIEWVNNKDEKHGICNAVAGSGKSTTLLLVAQSLEKNGFSPNDIKIIVFGKLNSVDLVNKFGQKWKHSISTLHSIGFKLTRKIIDIKPKVDKFKYHTISKELGYFSTSERWGKLLAKEYISSESQFIGLFNLCRLNLLETTSQNLRQLARYHGLDEIYDYKQCAIAMYDLHELGLAITEQNGTIDYTDMVYYPVDRQFWICPWFVPSLFVLVDECQDLNPLQKIFSMGLVGHSNDPNSSESTKGRLLYVGDPHQAIFGFAGASCNSYYEIKEATNALELPLSLCYRCPKSHIRLVNQIFPEIPIKATDKAIEGVLTYSDKDKLQHRENDLILCRSSAPLIAYCFELISQGFLARIKGRDIGKSLLKELDRVCRYNKQLEGKKTDSSSTDISNFLNWLESYQIISYARLISQENSEVAIESLGDRLNCLKEVFMTLGRDSSRVHLERRIAGIFTDSNSAILLSTIHRAKGLEQNRVFVLEYDLLPLTWSKQKDWEFQQECNLLYVALTRSKNELTLVVSNDKNKE